MLLGERHRTVTLARTPVPPFRVMKAEDSMSDSDSTESEEARSRRDRHRPGYIAPKRAGKRSVAGFLDDDYYNAIHQIARRHNATIGDTVAKALREFVNRYAPKPG